ncbi:putative porin [Salinimicrobium sp. GXAS 041]|uniref:putative porin n=1 Tax=Salinimicrobium sp. GXAS 041 TaxID=3400806 RepID=UPI003C71D15F
MKKAFLFISFIISFAVSSQTRLTQPGVQQKPAADSLPEVPITAYKIISVSRDTIYVDTSLTIEDEYEFNYLRKDNFELVPFSNVGQTYNKLSYDFKSTGLFPEFGARARHFNFYEVEDVHYYHVPTPLTELFFKTVYEQGQILDAFFTVNTSSNLNFSIAYKGMRSLGRYQHILTSTGNFRTTINYTTPNKKYRLWTHFVSQDLMNEENGGLAPFSLTQYINEEEEIEDRSRLDVNFENAQSTLFGKRFYLDHAYSFNSGDAENNLILRHKLNFSDKEYLFEQATASSLFGPSYENVNVRDETEYQKVYNEVSATFKNGILGEVSVKGGLTNYNYGYNTALIIDQEYIVNRMVGETFSAGGGYTTQWGDFSFYSEAMLNISGEFNGNYLKAGASYPLFEEVDLALSASTSSRAPNMNFLLYQSDYINYNWQNDFSNINMQNAIFGILSQKFINLTLEYNHFENYTYFGKSEEEFTSPMQHDGALNYVKAKAEKKIEFGVFGLANTVMYQKVLDEEDVLNVPQFITRNSLYYQDHWFQRALFLQTGLTLKYFTKYHMDAYDPILAEFYVQNAAEFGDYPVVDFFFNGRIKQARVFFKLEHVNSLITGNDNFSAPLYPYKDFAVRFGLVWNFFM